MNCGQYPSDNKSGGVYISSQMVNFTMETWSVHLASANCFIISNEASLSDLQTAKAIYLLNLDEGPSKINDRFYNKEYWIRSVNSVFKTLLELHVISFTYKLLEIKPNHNIWINCDLIKDIKTHFFTNYLLMMTSKQLIKFY